MKEIRLLKANEIDVRIGTINEKGATLLLYKDARVDMNILDETVKPEGWQRKHYELKGHIYASVGIKIGEEWIWKDDVGTESVTEATKGESSDSFKRACFNWGIGRELYTAPFTWINSDSYNGYINSKTGKWATYDKFAVVKIDYDDNKEISVLEIKNLKSGRIVFKMGSPLPKSPKEIVPASSRGNGNPEPMGKPLSELDQARIDIGTELKHQGYNRPDTMVAFIKDVLGKETISSIEEAREVAFALETNEDFDNQIYPGDESDGQYND